MGKKILLIYAKGVGELFNRQAALGSYILCLCNILEKNGNIVYVNGVLLSELKETHKEGVKLVSVSKRNKLSSFIPGIVKSALRFRKTLHKIDFLNKRLETFSDFDIVLEFYSVASNAGYTVSSRNQKPLVVIYDSPVIDEFRIFNKSSFFLERKILQRERITLLNAKSIVVYSNPVKDYLNKKLNKSLPVFIHQNVDFTRFEFIDKKDRNDLITIGFIGSFLKWHRVDLLLSSFIRLKKAGKKVHLLLLGNGLEFQKIKEKVIESGLENEIEMPGFADGKELYNYKLKMDIGVMPGSNWYGAPNKIFEYGAAGLSVVAPDTPTIKDIFKNDEVAFFRQDNENDLYEKLIFLLDHSDILFKKAEILQRKIREGYNERITTEFYLNLLQ